MATLAFVAIAAYATSGSGAIVGAVALAAASAAGAIVDQTLVYPAIFGQKQSFNGPRIDDLQIQTASEGSPVNFLLGTGRMSGTLIWVGPLIEVQEKNDNGGKGAGGTKSTTFTYYNSLSVGICEGPINGIKQIWADSRVIWKSTGFYNLLRWSDSFDSSTVWTVEPDSGAITVVADADPGPHGDNTADLITVNEAGSDTELAQRFIRVKQDGQYTISFWVKAGTLTTANFSLWDRSNRAAIIDNQPYTMTGTWQQIVATFTTPADCTSLDFIIVGTPAATGNFYLDEAQLEEGATLNPYDSTGAVSIAQDGTVYDSVTIHTGTSDQAADPIIEADQGAGNVSGFHGLCYVTFERLALTPFGNRIPQFSFLVEEDADLNAQTLMGKLLARGGLQTSEYDVSDVWTYPVGGMLTAGPQAVVRLMEPILVARNLMAVESLGLVKVIQREKSLIKVVSENDLAAHDPADDVPRTVTYTDISSFDLPSEVDVTYNDPDLEYQQGNARERRSIFQADAVKKVDLPLIITNFDARNLAFRELWSSWSERRGVEVLLPPRYIDMEETDLIQITNGLEVHKVRVARLTRGSNFIVQAQGAIESSESVAGVAEVASATPMLGFTAAPAVYEARPLELIVLDIPALRGSDVSEPGFYWTVAPQISSDVFIGAGLYSSSDDVNFTLLGTANVAGTILVALTLLADGPTGVWDNIHTVDVQALSGQLESHTEDEVLTGSNRVLLGNEILGFQTATLIGVNQYRLSVLLRGLRDTGPQTSTHQLSERGVLLESPGVQFKPVNLNALGAARYYRAVPIGGFVEDFDSLPFTINLTGATLKPFAPVDIAGTRDGTNNLTISWERDTRALTSPLGLAGATQLADETDSYEIDVLDGSDNVVRTIPVSASTATYSAANQSTDGLTPGDPVTVNIYQISSVIGRGFPGKATI